MHLIVYLLGQEWESSCFATNLPLLYHALPTMALVLVLFVIFGDLCQLIDI